MKNHESLQVLAERVAAQAKSGEELEVFVSRGRTTSVKAYNQEVEAFTSAQSMGIGIRVIADHRQGFAWAGTLDDDAITTTLAEARDNVRYGEPDEALALARPDGVAFVELDLWHDALVEFPESRKIDFAIELERRVSSADRRIAGVRTSSFSDSAGEASVATSTGISVANRNTFCSLSVTALAREGDQTTVGGGFDLAREPDALDLDRAVEDAVTRATRMLGARQPASQRVAIFLEPRVSAAIFGIVGGTLSGDAVIKRRSPFADRLGQQIASPHVTLVDDPTDSRSFGADSHDGEGLACRRNLLIERGVLKGFLHNTYTARRANTASTASAVRGTRSTPGVGAMALQVTPGTLSYDEILRSIDLGVFVQSLSGLHSGVNPISGDFSVGIEGLMIRNGALAEPVREATIGSTIQRLLADIAVVGADLEWLPGGSGSCTVVIGDVTLSGA